MDPDEKDNPQQNGSDEDRTVLGSPSTPWSRVGATMRKRRGILKRRVDVEGAHRHPRGGFLASVRVATRKESAVGIACIQWSRVVLKMCDAVPEATRKGADDAGGTQERRQSPRQSPANLHLPT